MDDNTSTANPPAPGSSVAAPAPQRRVSWRFIATLFGAQTLFFVALLGPAIIGIGVKVQTLVTDADRAASLAQIAAVGALAATLSNVVFGRLSDRTTSRFGRRRPWIVLGTVIMLIGLTGVAASTTVPLMACAWAVTQMGANMTIAPFNASAADQVPSVQRGQVTALMGIAPNLGVMGGSYVARTFVDQMYLLFALPGVLAVVVMAVYAVVLPDRRLPARPDRLTLREALRTFWVNPARHPDFSLAWLSRFMIEIAMFLFTTFRLFFVQDRLGMPVAEAAGTVATGVLVYTIVLVPAAFIAGRLSDRLGRRKVFVGSAALLFAIGTGLLVTVHDAPTFFVVEAILGFAYGVYMGVDLALVMDVLPNPDDAGKDLGLFNIAKALPQTLAPMIGAGLLAIGSVASQNYTVLLLAAGGIGLLGALAVVPIKKVR